MAKMSSMQANALLEAALQLKGTGWRVASSSFGGKPAEMEIVMEGGKIGVRSSLSTYRFGDLVSLNR